MIREPGIDKRIKRLSILLVDGGHAERLVEFTKALVNGRRRPINPKKATRKLALELLPHVIQARKALKEAEGYLLACLTEKEISRLGPYQDKSHKPEEKEETEAEQGC